MRLADAALAVLEDAQVAREDRVRAPLPHLTLDAQRALVVLARRRDLVALHEDAGEAAERIAGETLLSDLVEDREGLLLELHRVVERALASSEDAEVAERHSFEAPVADLSGERERRLPVAPRIGVAPLVEMHAAEPKKEQRLRARIARLARKRDSLVEEPFRNLERAGLVGEAALLARDARFGG